MVDSICSATLENGNECGATLNSTAVIKHPGTCCSCYEEDLDDLQTFLDYAGLRKGKGVVATSADVVAAAGEDAALIARARKAYKIQYTAVKAAGKSDKAAMKSASLMAKKAVGGDKFFESTSYLTKLKGTKTAALAGKTGRRVLKGAGYAVEGVVAANDIGRAIKSGNATAITRSSTGAAAGFGAGWAGAEIGAVMGAWGGPIGIGIGAIAGGIIGGVSGAMVTEYAVDKVAEGVGADYICDKCLHDDSNKILW